MTSSEYYNICQELKGYNKFYFKLFISFLKFHRCLDEFFKNVNYDHILFFNENSWWNYILFFIISKSKDNAKWSKLDYLWCQKIQRYESYRLHI